ncbi:hypothetical protein H8E07_12630 [bacterium]|nr:hypothetical protein [bacterium]
MQKLLFLVWLILIGCGAPVTAEPIDPDHDGMSVYFDEEATTFAYYVDDWIPAIGAGPTITAYLIITRPYLPYPFLYIRAWEAHIEIITNSLTPPLRMQLEPCSVDYDNDPDDYVIGFCPCIGIDITGDAVILGHVELNWLGIEGRAEAEFFITGVEGSLHFPDGPGYAVEAGFPSPCQPIFGTWGLCAWVNVHTIPIKNETMTWGDVKTLY